MGVVFGAWGYPLTSMRILQALVVNRGLNASNGGLLSREPGFLTLRLKFLSPGTLAFFGTSELSVQISMTRMKSAAFLKASASVVSFCSAKANLKRPLLRLFKKDVYDTPSSKSGISTAS